MGRYLGIHPQLAQGLWVFLVAADGADQKGDSSLWPARCNCFHLAVVRQVAEKFEGVTKAYYAFDPYQFYDWDSSRIISLEKRLLGDCAIAFGVARLLVEDLKGMAATPVHYLPNATQWQPGDTNVEGATAAVKDFQSVPGQSGLCGADQQQRLRLGVDRAS